MVQEQSWGTAHSSWIAFRRETGTKGMSQAGDKLPWDSSTLLCKSWVHNWSEMGCHQLQKHIPDNSSSALTWAPAGPPHRANTVCSSPLFYGVTLMGNSTQRLTESRWEAEINCKGNPMSKSTHEKKQPEINRLVCTTVFLLKNRKGCCKLRPKVREKPLGKQRGSGAQPRTGPAAP